MPALPQIKQTTVTKGKTVTRLFWKIFLWFWTAMVALVLLLLCLEWFVPLEPPGVSQRALLHQALRAEAGRAATALRTGGATALNRELEAFEDSTGAQVFWVNYAGEEPPETALTAPMVTPIVGQIARQLAQNPEADAVLWRAAGLRIYAAVKTPLPNTVLIIRLARAVGPVRPTSRLVRLLAAVFVASVVCWLLARNLVAPIEALRRASQRLAEGDLEARVAPAVSGHRRDEIGLLAQDFDVMAERLQTLVDAQRRLLGDVSHELRTPLTRLRLAMALLDRDLPAAEGVATVGHRERMETEIAVLDGLIDELLTLSRLENRLDRREALPAAVTFDAVRFDVVACLREVVKDLAWEAGQNPSAVTVSLECECDTALVAGEPALFRRAVENIGRNALRHSPPGGEVRFGVRRADSRLHVSISDDGPGVPDAELEAIFQPFYRTANSTGAGGSAGHGLGLAIAQRAIETQGGTVRALNRAPHGLELRIDLPLP